MLFYHLSMIEHISTHSLLAEADGICGTLLFCMMYFNSQPPCGGRQPSAVFQPPSEYFNSQPPCGGRRLSSLPLVSSFCISTHSLLAEADCMPNVPLTLMLYFNSQPPCGGRRNVFEYLEIREIISTHSLLAEADPASVSCVESHSYFNSQPPCGGRLKFFVLNISGK